MLTLRSSWSQTASFAASEAECEAEAFAPELPRLALRTITGLLRETRRTLRMNSGALWKPSMYVQICFTVGSVS